MFFITTCRAVAWLVFIYHAIVLNEAYVYHNNLNLVLSLSLASSTASITRDGMMWL